MGANRRKKADALRDAEFRMQCANMKLWQAQMEYSKHVAAADSLRSRAVDRAVITAEPAAPYDLMALLSERATTFHERVDVHGNMVGGHLPGGWKVVYRAERSGWQDELKQLQSDFRGCLSRAVGAKKQLDAAASEREVAEQDLETVRNSPGEWVTRN